MPAAKTDQQQLIGEPPVLVAHRGYSGRYPENTLRAYKAAYKHGARFMELDLQLTADHVPVLHHDASLLRMAGIDLDVREVTNKYFKSLNASYPDRFGEEFEGNAFTTLRKYCKWLKKHPKVITFVEIKQESIDSFGIPLFIDKVVERIKSAQVEDQSVIISFNPDALNYTREVSSLMTGWVLPHWNDEVKSRAYDEGYDYLFAGTAQLPEQDSAIWRGSWMWAIYNLDDVSSAIAMANRGIPMLETNQIGDLMADARLRPNKA